MVLTGGSGKYSPAEPAMLAQIRDRFYATDCSELDFTEEFNQLTELRKKYRNNQEQLQHSPEQYDVRKDAQEKFETVWAFVSANCRPVDRPSLYLSGGQPGAGKSRAIVRAQQLENGNLLNVVGDDFRKFCSLYGYYNQKYGRESSRYTGEFAGIMVGMIRDRAVAEKYNIAIEGTFRTSEIPLRELQTFTSSGYYHYQGKKNGGWWISFKICSERALRHRGGTSGAQCADNLRFRTGGRSADNFPGKNSFQFCIRG